MAQTLKNLLAMQETQVQSLGQEDPREKGMATHSNNTLCPERSILPATRWAPEHLSHPGLSSLTLCSVHLQPHLLNASLPLPPNSLVSSTGSLGYYSQFSSVAQLCLILCADGLQHARLPCHHALPELAQTHVH